MRVIEQYQDRNRKVIVAEYNTLIEAPTLEDLVFWEETLLKRGLDYAIVQVAKQSELTSKPKIVYMYALITDMERFNEARYNSTWSEELGV